MKNCYGCLMLICLLDTWDIANIMACFSFLTGKRPSLETIIILKVTGNNHSRYCLHIELLNRFSHMRHTILWPETTCDCWLLAPWQHWLFCCKACRKWLEHERSVGRNMRPSQVFFPTSWVTMHGSCNLTPPFLNSTLLYISPIFSVPSIWEKDGITRKILNLKSKS